MTSFCRFLQIFSLGTWLGGIIFLSFVLAPAAFGILSSRDQAGTLVGFSLERLHAMGIIAGLVYLAATASLAWFAASAPGSSFGGLARPAALIVVLMIVLTAASNWGVSPRLRALRQQMGSVDATPPENPLRAQFDRLHQISVRLEGAVLLLGLAALYLTAQQKG
jgi:uncharacterized membrane protein